MFALKFSQLLIFYSTLKKILKSWANLKRFLKTFKFAQINFFIVYI